MKIRTALVSNADSRLRSVLRDLHVHYFFDPVVLSEEVAAEKPARQIFLHAMRTRLAGELPSVTPKECLHVGDELKCDYHGAREAGMRALLLRRAGLVGQEENKEEREDLTGLQVIQDLWGVVKWIRRWNKEADLQSDVDRTRNRDRG